METKAVKTGGNSAELQSSLMVVVEGGGYQLEESELEKKIHLLTQTAHKQLGFIICYS